MEYKQFTKISKAIIAVGIVSAIIIFMWIFLFVIPSNSKASLNGWKVNRIGTIVDVDPIYSAHGDIGLFFEFDNGYWVWVWTKYREGEAPGRGDHGSFYRKVVRGEIRHKWVSIKKKVKVVKKITPIIKTTAKHSWISIKINTPLINKTVLVRYENRKTITTAYINNKKEWRLETDREKVLGGRAIKTVKEWKEILR